MTDKTQTIIHNGKEITLDTATLDIITELQGKEGLFLGGVKLLKEQSSTVIQRSTSEGSSNNYNCKLRITNLIMGDRRMGGFLWCQVKKHTTDEEDLAKLIQQFPEAKVMESDRP